MLNFKKSAYDKTGHGYNPSLSSSSTSSSALRDVIFVPPTTNVNSKITDSKNKIDSQGKHDIGKSILGASLKIVKKETKQNTHHSTNKKSQLKKTHFCHHFGALGHTCPNCYKWLANVSSFGKQNQFQNSLSRLGELLKVVLFLTNFNGINPPTHLPKQRRQKKKTSPSSKSPIWKEKDSSK